MSCVPGKVWSQLCALIFIIISNFVHGGLSLPEGQPISIVASSNKYRDSPYHTGVYVSYPNKGRVEFIGASEAKNAQHRDLRRFSLLDTFYFSRPSVIAEGKGTVYVWDEDLHALIAVDLYYGHRRILTRDKRIKKPSQIAVSPERKVLIIDKQAGRIFWFEDTNEKNIELNSEVAPSSLLSSGGATFLSWDTLIALDSATSELKMFRISTLKNAFELSLMSVLPLDTPKHGQSYSAITAQDGQIYIADAAQVYTYVIDSGELVPATPGGVFSDIRQVAASFDHLFVLDGEELKPVPKTIAVEIEFDASAPISQSALIRLYLYLDRVGLLPTGQKKVDRDYQTLRDFLVHAGVLFFAYDNKSIEEKTAIDADKERAKSYLELSAIQQEFGYWFCRSNREFCLKKNVREILWQPLRKNENVTLPKINIESRLRQRAVTLRGVMASQELNKSVFSEKNVSKASSFSVLKKLNKNINVNNKSEFLKLKKGTVNLPYEQWSLTTSVPAHDYYDSQSELYRITSSNDINIYSLEVYTEQSAKSHHNETAEAGDCRAIKSQHEELLNSIKYPQMQYYSEDEFGLDEFPGVIGIVENKKHVVKNHAKFYGDVGPAWHSPAEFDELAPDANVVPLAESDTHVAKIGDYVKGRHHGTHVAALIAGRHGPCWSGLLPSSRIVLVDAPGTGVARREITKIRKAGVKVFNVSQELTDDQTPSLELNKLKKLMTDKTQDVLYVVAAGQATQGAKGEDLNEVAAKPYPAGWGDSGNIISVTSDFEKANYGKRYVDLLTVGVNILSATEKYFFGTATGTSQATPLATAAAAYLAGGDGGNQSPGDVKARLIATARWNAALLDKVWGGILDFEDAVKFYGHNVFQTFLEGEETTYTLVKPKGGAKLTVKSFDENFYVRSGEGASVDEGYKIKFEHLLSLRRNEDSTFRVVFKDPVSNRVKIILNAVLEGKLKARGAKVFNATDRQFSADETGKLFFEGGINVSQVTEYFADMPYHVKW